MKKNDTSWENVAGWYDDLLSTDEDSYQLKVIMPNLERIMAVKPDEVVLDNACGQGFFTRLWHKSGAQVIAADLSPTLIETAKKNSPKDILFFTAPAHKLPHVVSKSVDKISIVLALQNIENLSDVFAECARVLKPEGRMIFVLNHPAFRVPKGSSWHYDEESKTQYRRINRYMSDSKNEIIMNPGSLKKKVTVSFHRPLQVYVKALSKVGFAITRLEEWISHKKSEKGPRMIAEDTARKEIPMFLCIEVGKITK